MQQTRNDDMILAAAATTPKGTTSLAARLLGYATAAGATLLATTPAAAEVVYVDIPDVVRGFNAPFSLDLDGDGLDDITLAIDQSGSASYGYRTSYRRFKVEVPAGHGLFATAMSAPLGSNYALNTTLAWISGATQLAFFSTAKSPGYPVDITQGGAWLGAANKFLGLRFLIGADTHYAWIRLSVGAQAQSFTIADYAYEDAPDTPLTTGVWLAIGDEGAPGSAFAVPATDVDPGLPAFTAKPKVTGVYFDPIKPGKAKRAAAAVVTKIVKGVPEPEVRCEWRKLVRLYDAKAFKAAYARGETAEDFLLAKPIADLNAAIEVQAKDGARTYRRNVWQYRLRPPAITEVTDPDDNPVVQAGLGQFLKVNGEWFGKKAPKAWLEYTVGGKVRMVKLKILKPYRYADALGKPGASTMDPDTGDSTLFVQMPATWPGGWQHGPHHLVIDNGVGLATLPFATGL